MLNKEKGHARGEKTPVVQQTGQKGAVAENKSRMVAKPRM